VTRPCNHHRVIYLPRCQENLEDNISLPMTTYAFRFKFWGCSVSKCQAASAIDIGSCERCQRHYWADHFVLQIISAKWVSEYSKI
jgi:dissimilatory sulfite reductase (desulfoviridin) alpha/beta subunit